MQVQSLRLRSLDLAEVSNKNQSQLMEEFQNNGKLIIKNKVLLSPGNWNGIDFSAEEIRKGYEMTDWTDKDNFALIYDHDEKAVNWLGNVVNIRLENDTLIGDLEIFDDNLARKLTLGGAKLGISARVLGKEDENGAFVNFTFNNFSVVYDPACKNAYINLSKDKALERIKELREQLEELEAGITGSSASSGSPIGDAETNKKIKYGKKKEKKEEMGEKFDKVIKEIKDSLRKAHPEWDEKKIESTAYATANARKIDKNMEESDSQLLKGGKNLVNKMEETQKPVEEQPEEVVEEAKPEEAAPEAPAEEEASEETELSSKLDVLLSEIKKLSEKVAKLEEASEEEAPAAEAEEAPAEEAAEEESEEEAEEPEKAELKAQKKSLSVPEVQELSGPRHALLGNTYSQAEMRLAKVLQENARE